jgi:succinate dehydrogenase / fumarate reductase cytochrome b subunit
VTTDRRAFYLRRLHSLSGIVPIGAYLFAHIFVENIFVLGGHTSFQNIVGFIGSFPPPLLLAVEVLGVWGPLLFHSVYGFVRVGQADLENPLRNDHLGAYLYTLQRISGVIAFFFIAYHVWSTRIQYYLGNAEITFDFMHAKLIDPLIFSTYLIGVLACVFHFTNGIWTFSVTWGITVGQHAQRTLRAACMVFFVVMYGTAFAIIMAFRT